MDGYQIRLAIASDISAVYDLLNDYVIEQGMEKEFKNSRTSFEEHFDQGLFRALVIEVQQERGNQKYIVGCIFCSIFYEYVVGLTTFLHCCYIKPDFRSNGLEQKLVQRAKKISLDADIENMLTMSTRGDISYRSALEAEDAINLTSTIAIDVWIMPNHSSTSNFTYNDYVIRDGTQQDLGGIYHLLEELAEMEDITADFTVTKEEFERNGSVDKDVFKSVILEHRCPVGDQEAGENKVTNDVIGCMSYSKMYYALVGRTYFLQGLYLKPGHKGKGLGKALLHKTLEACKKRNGDGFLFMIVKENKTSQSLFRSLHATNMSQSKHGMEWIKPVY